ncbi:MAG TPA: hypothetical protein VK281_08740, partial [Xanthobacteraceae bacterium]|nr:hypothetical protein [Xanthobacteraceae bacterium]
ATVVGLPNFINPPFETHTHFDMTGHLVRVGLNYKINWAPPWATLGAPGIVATAPYVREFQVEFGARYWMSSGKTSKHLVDITGTATVSRLTYSDVTAHTGESFRVDHWSGAFVKSYLGTGPTAGGNLKDEDFAPFVVAQSAATSGLQDGALTYGSVDAGYSFCKVRATSSARLPAITTITRRSTRSAARRSAPIPASAMWRSRRAFSASPTTACGIRCGSASTAS